MQYSRRDLGLLLPMAAAIAAKAQEHQPLPARIYHSDAIPYAGDGAKKGRQFFHGVNHTGFALEMHETILGPGIQTHAPHKHEHEEVLVVFEGRLEALLDGKTEAVEAGSVIYFGSNQMHSVRNIGRTPCRYYVLELRGSES